LNSAPVTFRDPLKSSRRLGLPHRRPAAIGSAEWLVAVALAM
jgi:hypothetical protein